MYEYKLYIPVTGQSKEVLESNINFYAKQGWELLTVTPTYIFIFRRQVDA